MGVPPYPNPVTRRKRSLSQTGGRCRLSGDPGTAALLARCLDVDPTAELPFTHGFHAYPARMHPETARRALEAFPATSILDPFVGSGTTALEAVRRGLPFAGLDVSRVALEIAWVRTRVLPPEACRRVETAGHRIARRARADPPFELPPWSRPEREWYSPHTLREVCLLKALIDQEEDPALRRILACVLSSIAVKLSRQTSDSDPRPDPAFRPWPRGTAFRWFADRATELTKALLRLSSDLHKRRVPFAEPALLLADARTAAPGPVDLVLTSPPYAATYDYALHQARRIALLGLDDAFAREHEIGSRRAEGRGYRKDLEACFRNALGALTAGGRMLVLIGDGREGRTPLRADALVAEAVRGLGAQVAAVASQRRPGGGSGPPRWEHFLLVKL